MGGVFFVYMCECVCAFFFSCLTHEEDVWRSTLKYCIPYTNGMYTLMVFGYGATFLPLSARTLGKNAKDL